MNHLTASERKRFEICKKTISDGLQSCFDVGAALIEVRDMKLYREDFKTFEIFCEGTYQIARRQAYRLIDAAEVKESVKGAAAELLTNERAARELIDVPPEKRESVILKTSKQGPVTAENLKAVVNQMCPMGHISNDTRQANSSKNTPKSPHAEPPIIELDKVGFPIPENISELWNRGDVVKPLLDAISEVRCAVAKAQEDRDMLFNEVNFSAVIAELNNAYAEIKRARPYAVCYMCQGKLPKQCVACKGKGFHSEFFWKTCVAEEHKQLRKILAEKGARK